MIVSTGKNQSSGQMRGGKQVRQRPFIVIAAFLAGAVSLADAGGADTDKLQGVWHVQSIVRNGKKAPSSETRGIWFTFKGDKLIIKGNHDDESDDVCTYTIDASKSPKTLDIAGPKSWINNPMLCIYTVIGDELKICYRKTSPGRPTDFTSDQGSENTVIEFKREPPSKK
jgi:uncharacterized protein (TIGR03067 family)